MLILLDILLVSAIFYVLLAWLRVSIPQSTSRRIMLTAPIVGAVYISARAFNLFMLERMIEVLFIVVLIGLVVVFQTDIRRTVVAPIELRNLPENWTVEGTVPAEAEVVLVGSEHVFRRLDPENLTISIDLSEPQAGPVEIAIAEEDLKLPAGIDLEEVNPRVLDIRLQRLRSMRLPVSVRTTGALPGTLTLMALRAEPDTVTLMMPEEAADRLHEIPTEAIDLAQITEATTIESRIIPPPDARLPAEATPDVRIHVDVRPKSTPADTSFGQ